MGLTISHNCWHEAYSEFKRWRIKLAEVAGLPPLELYVQEPFKHNADLKPDILYELLYHSDCEGELPSDICSPLADRLEELLPLLSDESGGEIITSWKQVTQRFIDGLRKASKLKEDVEFY